MKADIVHFVKPTSTGNQEIAHSLGETPKAILFIASLVSAFDTTTTHAYQMRGIYDGSSNVSMFGAGHDAGSNSTKHGLTDAACIWMVIANGSTVMGKATVTAWDEDSFTLNWSVANAVAWKITAIVLGGDQLSAKIVSWQMPSSTGQKEVAGVGFQPDFALHLFQNIETASTDLHAAAMSLGLGVMNGNNEWYMHHYHAGSLSTSNALHTQGTNGCLGMIASTENQHYLAAFNSWTLDGFKLDFTITGGGEPTGLYRAFTLCLQGAEALIGSWVKSTGGAPATDNITGYGLRELGIFASAFVTSNPDTGSGDSYMSLGYRTSSIEGAFHIYDKDNTTSEVRKERTTASKSIVRFNDSGVLAEADITLNADGFDVEWTTNDGTAHHILFALLGIDANVVRIDEDIGIVESIGFPSRYANIAESISIDDAFLLDLPPVISIEDTITVSEGISFPERYANIEEIITLSEAFFSGEADVFVILEEVISISDIVGFPSKYANVFETISITDSAGRIARILESILVADTVGVGVTIHLAETVTISEAIALTILLHIEEPIDITEAIVKIRALSEPVTVGDVLALIKESPVGSETVRVSDSVSVIKKGIEDVSLVDDADVYIEVPARKQFITVIDKVID